MEKISSEDVKLTMLGISNEDLQFFVDGENRGERLKFVDPKFALSIASDLLQTRADLAAARAKLEEICRECGVYEDEPENALEVIKSLNKRYEDFISAREELERYRWILVGERLPEVDKPVLVLNKADMCFVVRLTKDNHWVNEEDAFFWFITHWMPLPLPPKDGTL